MRNDVEAGQQRQLCSKYKVAFSPPEEGSTLGFAIESQGKTPVCGIRHLPSQGTSGWYVWCGEKSDADDFFKPLHAEHLSVRCPAAVRFLALPPGYGFIVDGDYVDVWYDENFLVE